MRFWDSSGIVPLLVAQAVSERMLALYRADPEVVAWWGTRVECDSALARLEREGMLTAEGTSEALARLDLLARNWSEVQAADDLRPIARRLLRTHSLRAGDALQLAAAIVACEQDPPSLPLVCLDERLVLAARREGFTPIAS